MSKNRRAEKFQNTKERKKIGKKKIDRFIIQPAPQDNATYLSQSSSMSTCLSSRMYRRNVLKSRLEKSPSPMGWMASVMDVTN
jgi:hypothetical protein